MTYQELCSFDTLWTAYHRARRCKRGKKSTAPFEYSAIEELPYNYTISLQTTSEPYGLTIHFDSVTAHVLGVERDIDKRMYAIAPSLLALIGNLGQVQWTYAAPDGTAVTRSVTLEEVDQALPDWIEAYNLDAGADWTAPESVKDYATSPAALQQLLDLTCHGFYVVTEEDGTTIFTPQF